ncbi:MAG: hypothetical protein AUH87_05925 [Deltaproteobacteria bacterium 13_1_40CM_4_54_4]|nr:MAG: hypothetical protein AUH87_05925 [Deltaproteobacteria bacterium 13_1_40CM_4_54_4]TMB65497.1 MAG: hypothetical protein E6J54_25375 [Deltaproteobacteria bacterium]
MSHGLDGVLECYPFLRGVPPEILRSLDVDELLLPTSTILETKQRLESTVNAWIVIYRCSQQPQFSSPQLCRTLVAASLSAKDHSLLHQAEERFAKNGVSFVAYARPLAFRKDLES